MENKVTLHDKTFKLFIPNEKIEKAIDEVAGRLFRCFLAACEQ